MVDVPDIWIRNITNQKEQKHEAIRQAFCSNCRRRCYRFFVSLTSQNGANTPSGGLSVTIANLPLPVGVNNFPGTLTGATVPVSGNVTANINLPNPLPVQTAKQSAANFKTLIFDGTNYLEVLQNGSLSTGAFTIPQGAQFVITDVSWVAVCLTISSVVCEASAGDAVAVELGNGSYLSEATYANRVGILLAGRSDHLTSGIVVTQVPTPKGLGGPFFSGEGVSVTLQGYLVP